MDNAQRENPAAPTNGARQQSSQSKSQYTDSPLTILFQRLEKLRETGRGQYLARCPAHNDGNPSLSIRECSDGTILLHCFALCPAGDVLAAVGLELRDLFPQRYESRPKPRHERRINPLDALRALDHEAIVLAVVASDIQAQGAIDQTTYARLVTAVARIGAARELYR